MSAAEPKFTIDANGNWICIQVIRIRLGNGWVETIVPAPSRPEQRGKAA